jgi:hypothetical protein
MKKWQPYQYLKFLEMNNASPAEINKWRTVLERRNDFGRYNSQVDFQLDYLRIHEALVANEMLPGDLDGELNPLLKEVHDTAPIEKAKSTESKADDKSSDAKSTKSKAVDKPADAKSDKSKQQTALTVSHPNPFDAIAEEDKWSNQIDEVDPLVLLHQKTLIIRETC